MLLFPNAKINLGLDIIAKRPDGYHELATCIVPVSWCDILEIVPSASGNTTLSVTGNKVDCPPHKNLVMKAYALLASRFDIPPVDIFLHKIIPDGAGLGGGSSDAAFTLKGLNELFSLGLTDQTLASIALELGADCPFFICNKPAIATGIGEILSPAHLPHTNLHICIAKPPFSISTVQAYAGVTPKLPSTSLVKALSLPANQWKHAVSNDFESPLSTRFPQIENLKNIFYDRGAVYASLSGSGSAVYGIFESDKMAEDASLAFPGCVTFHHVLSF